MSESTGKGRGASFFCFCHCEEGHRADAAIQTVRFADPRARPPNNKPLPMEGRAGGSGLPDRQRRVPNQPGAPPRVRGRLTNEPCRGYPSIRNHIWNAPTGLAVLLIAITRDHCPGLV